MTENPPCAAYAEDRLVAVYDPLNPADHDYRFYRALAGSAPLRVLDLGAGTGRLALGLAGDGHEVAAVEPASGMRRRGEARTGGAVEWIGAGAADFASEKRFDLAVMTGHVFQVFLSDEEVLAVLGNLRGHLAEGGRLAFETRNPLVADWKSWTPQETAEEVETPGVGTVRVHYDLRTVDGELVTFETHFAFPDGTADVAVHTLRFMPKETLEGLLAEAGFRIDALYGDWYRSAWTAASPEIIVVARAN